MFAKPGIAVEGRGDDSARGGEAGVGSDVVGSAGESAEGPGWAEESRSISPRREAAVGIE